MFIGAFFISDQTFAWPAFDIMQALDNRLSDRMTLGKLQLCKTPQIRHCQYQHGIAHVERSRTRTFAHYVIMLINTVILSFTFCKYRRFVNDLTEEKTCVMI